MELFSSWQNQVFFFGLVLQLIYLYLTKNVTQLSNSELDNLNSGMVIFDDNHLFEKTNVIRDTLLRQCSTSVAWVYLTVAIIVQMGGLLIRPDLKSTIDPRIYIVSVILAAIILYKLEKILLNYFYNKAIVSFGKYLLSWKRKSQNLNEEAVRERTKEDLKVMLGKGCSDSSINKVLEKIFAKE